MAWNGSPGGPMMPNLEDEFGLHSHPESPNSEEEHSEENDTERPRSRGQILYRRWHWGREFRSGSWERNENVFRQRLSEENRPLLQMRRDNSEDRSRWNGNHSEERQPEVDGNQIPFRSFHDHSQSRGRHISRSHARHSRRSHSHFRRASIYPDRSHHDHSDRPHRGHSDRLHRDHSDRIHHDHPDRPHHGHSHREHRDYPDRPYLDHPDRPHHDHSGRFHLGHTGRAYPRHSGIANQGHRERASYTGLSHRSHRERAHLNHTRQVHPGHRGRARPNQMGPAHHNNGGRRNHGHSGRDHHVHTRRFHIDQPQSAHNNRAWRSQSHEEQYFGQRERFERIQTSPDSDLEIDRFSAVRDMTEYLLAQERVRNEILDLNGGIPEVRHSSDESEEDSDSLWRPEIDTEFLDGRFTRIKTTARFPKGVRVNFNIGAWTNQTNLSLHTRFTILRTLRQARTNRLPTRRGRQRD